ncbi:MAG TPA: MFS transporter, partial [Gemmataceae bacterium]|nr:MFS transporter [Gemmataceae bacterium]
MSGFHAITALALSGAFVFGIVLALLGSIKLTLAKRLQISETQVGILLSALNLALLPMVLLSGLLIDQWGVRLVMILGSFVTCVAIYGLTLHQTSYRLAVVAILLVGLGAACVSTASVVLMPQAFFSGRPDMLGAALNLGMAFFALGALVTPALVDVLLARLSFRTTLGLVAVLCLTPALLAVVANIPGESQKATLGQVVADRYFWVAGLVFFLYAPLEASVGTWATTFLLEMGNRERRVAWLLSGFWLAFLASRLLAAYLQVAADAWVILTLGVLAAVLLGSLAGAPNR